MMNKSAIDWCDFSWNPITGCRRGCEYCYARNQARRFCGDTRLHKSSAQLQAANGPAGKIYTLAAPFKTDRGQTCAFPAGFEPTLHEYRLPDPAKKKKPASIFVCSMADLFAPGIPDEWIDRVFGACKAAPQHNYMFLTKSPERYITLANAGKLPTREERPNFWYGTTVTKFDDPFFGGADTYNTFVSVEPISSAIDIGRVLFAGVRWVIVGAETGYREGKVAPELGWIKHIVDTCRGRGVPVLLKDSAELRAVWPGELIQEFPEELRPMPEDNSIPHCKECPDAEIVQQGKRGESITCKATGQHARGRYTRSCPPWCPRRNKKE